MKRSKAAALAVAIVLVLCSLAGCQDVMDTLDAIDTIIEIIGQTQPATGDGLTAVQLDVGNEDCAVITCPDGEVIVIDAAESSSYPVIEEYLLEQGIRTIDAFIVTHPHSDHIGGAANVVENFQVKRVYMTDVSHTSRQYENLIDAISETGTPATRVKPGRTVTVGRAELEFLGPLEDYSGNLNNTSVVTRVTYAGRTLLYTGDIEKTAESDLLEKYGSYLMADVLKVPHHGSDTSSSKDFINAVAPLVAVIPCSEDNDYGHPAKSTLDRLNKVGAHIYRSDENGNIAVHIASNGEIGVYTER